MANEDFKVVNESGFNAFQLADALDKAPETDYGGEMEPPQVWMCVGGEVVPVRMVLCVEDFDEARGGDIVLYPEAE